MVTEYRGLLNPDRIEDYIALGGYTALLNAVATMTPQEYYPKSNAKRTARTRWRRLSNRA